MVESGDVARLERAHLKMIGGHAWSLGVDSIICLTHFKKKFFV